MNPQASTSSAFVTVVAWLFIIMSGFACFIGIMQNIVVYFLLPTEPMNAITQQPHSESIPVVAQFIMTHLKILFGAILLLALVSLTASIGLLLRKNWGRLMFIGLMLVAVIWNLGSLLLQQRILRSMSVPEDAPREFIQQSQAVAGFFSVFSILLAIVISLLFGWIAWRLTRATIRAEFI